MRSEDRPQHTERTGPFTAPVASESIRLLSDVFIVRKSLGVKILNVSGERSNLSRRGKC